MSGFKNLRIPVTTGAWSAWYPLQSYVGKNKYTISFEFVDSFMEFPFEVQVKYMTADGVKIQSVFGPGQYTIEGDGAGTDYIRIRGYALGIGVVQVTVPD
ncbi:hypothetical protein FKH01_23255 [Salmonella enterica]|nr:hypothetical protein [Salmonella enterica]EAU0602595.1 hypothetical protein [Salmonella enterica]EBH3176973.1 hypothetical protein [Salmonella enterica]EJH6882407.1 hypothetical protein [Salmonella enterica]ELQ6863892.1 hypothetical protein [Salmonella enterica]